MPEWLSITFGIVGGTVVIAGAVYLAFRPYLAVEPPKTWMPKPQERETLTSLSGDSGLDGLR